jgi:hypothetical protein
MFEVSKESGTVLRVYAVSKGTETKVLDLTLGKNARNQVDYFVKLPNEQKVRLSSGLNKYAFENSKASWRNRVVSAFEKDSFISAKVVEGKSEYEITRSSDKYFVNGTTLDAPKVDEFMHSINNLRSYEYADDNMDLKTAGLEPKCKISINIKLTGGDNNVKIGNTNLAKTQCYVSRENDPTIYLFGKDLIDNIEQSIKKFK